jgi:hypothetical protein
MAPVRARAPAARATRCRRSCRGCCGSGRSGYEVDPCVASARRTGHRTGYTPASALPAIPGDAREAGPQGTGAARRWHPPAFRPATVRPTQCVRVWGFWASQVMRDHHATVAPHGRHEAGDARGDSWGEIGEGNISLTCTVTGKASRTRDAFDQNRPVYGTGESRTRDGVGAVHRSSRFLGHGGHAPFRMPVWTSHTL